MILSLLTLAYYRGDQPPTCRPNPAHGAPYGPGNWAAGEQ